MTNLQNAQKRLALDALGTNLEALAVGVGALAVLLLVVQTPLLRQRLHLVE